MFRFITLILSMIFLLSSWPAIERQLENPGEAVDRVQTELRALKENPEVTEAAWLLLGDFQQFLKHTWVLVREISEDKQKQEPLETDQIVPVRPDEHF
ncbi:hypothetical protein [Bacillus sp. FJAT-27445]|uniref:hypothetical protein n=1 Tax=Bacillus sp. FJAT-27445 TaxID=1679166 RepID=UPI000743C67D|nr:hypothetical protein [Bacillus sp. FJAT-27445]